MKNNRYARIPLIFTLMVLAVSCGGRPGVNTRETVAEQPAPWDLVDENNPLPESPAVSEPVAEAVDTVLKTVAVNPEDSRFNDTVPPPTAAGMARYNRLGRLNELFNDSNKYQYAAGERIGISPIMSLADAYYLKRPLIEISSNKWYDIDKLTHSMPFLVPEAASLLETIGRNFADSLAKRGAPGHRFRVTSVLRTAGLVKKLRRVNRNATDSSTHQLGTTFDISYSAFNHPGSGAQLSDQELKYILAEVLYDLRKQNKCMVKYEIKSPCFHITATGR